MKNIKTKISTVLCAAMIASSLSVVANAATFGNSKNGASTKEVLQVKYDGAAWNYSGSGYNWASFTYSRNGRTLMKKYAYTSKVTGSVWDDLIHWDDAHTTKFNWNRG